MGPRIFTPAVAPLIHALTMPIRAGLVYLLLRLWRSPSSEFDTEVIDGSRLIALMRVSPAVLPSFRVFFLCEAPCSEEDWRSVTPMVSRMALRE